MKRKILRHMQKMSRVALLGVLAAAISVGGSLPTAFAATSYETVTERFRRSSLMSTATSRLAMSMPRNSAHM